MFDVDDMVRLSVGGGELSAEQLMVTVWFSVTSVAIDSTGTGGSEEETHEPEYEHGPITSTSSRSAMLNVGVKRDTVQQH